MSARTQQKLSPLDTWSLRGTDRRGANASLTAASATGITVTGHFSDQADFTVPLIFKRDDLYGYLGTGGIGASRYLPSGSLAGVVLDTDVAIAGAFSPLSVKYDSIGAASLSYTTEAGISGTKPLAQFVTSSTGGAVASLSITIGGTVVVGDLFYIVYLGNYQALYQAENTGTPATTPPTPTDAASGLTFAMNTGATPGLSIQPFAVWNGSTGLTIYAGRSAAPSQYTLSGTSLTINSAAQATGVGFWGVQVGDPVMFANGGAMEQHAVTAVTSPWAITLDSPLTLTPRVVMWPLYHADGNSMQLWVATNSAAGTMSNAGFPKLTGGASETSFHLHIDFTAAGIDDLFEAWFTHGPHPTYDSGATNAALVPFAPTDFSVAFSNWTITDPGNVTPLKVAGIGSVAVGSNDAWAVYAGTGWTLQAGFYYQGYAKVSATAGDSVTVTYSCQSTHDLYLGTILRSDGGTFSVELDRVAQPGLSTQFGGAGFTPIAARQLIAAGVAAGTHTVVLTVASGGGNCYFDFLQAAVLSGLIDPTVTYPAFSAACDADTAQTGQLPPARAIDIMQRAGFQGDVDLFAGSIFPYKMARLGGSFHQATVTIGGFITPNDAVFVNVAGTAFGVGTTSTSLDTFSTLAQRCVNAINTLFVGVCAAPTATAGQFTITQLSPINGFSLTVTPGTQLTISYTGDIATGNEGTWMVDASQTSPLTPALTAYLTDFATIQHAVGQSVTVAFSQEIPGNTPEGLSPTSSTAWAQRFADGTIVQTSTGFGSTGAGVVEALAAGVYQQTGHGYVTGNTAHFAHGASTGEWALVVTDANHYTLGTFIAGTSGYTPAVGDTVYIDLLTTQATFNPATMTAYMAAVYVQAANLLAAAGVTYRLQFGEVGWWFFSRYMSELVGYASWTAPISIGTAAPHNFFSGQNVIVAGVQGDTAANSTWPFVKTDSTHGTLTGSNGNATYTTGGTISGGGMAYYDAYTAAAAVTALGSALASFWTQDDDPSINSHADANFLRGLIYTHIHTIWTAVLAAQPAAQAEWLLPMDVNYPSVFWTNAQPYPQGGRLNNYVNIPPQYMAAGSDISRMKVEALSCGLTYRRLDVARVAMTYPQSAMSWAVTGMAYLFPWSDGSCPYTDEYLAALNTGTPLTGAWAMDQFTLQSLPLPLPSNPASAIVQ